MDLQLAHHYIHRHNASEQAIRNCENRFFNSSSTTDPYFPVCEWDCLLPQSTITINQLRNARFNPKLSYYAYIFGQYDSNKNPMAPPSKVVVVHDKPRQSTSWGHCGTRGRYIGEALDHCISMICCMPSTEVIRITNTFQYITNKFSFPKTTTEYYPCQAVGYIFLPS